MAAKTNPAGISGSARLRITELFERLKKTGWFDKSTMLKSDILVTEETVGL